MSALAEDTRTIPCWNCGATGPCPTCRGTGEWALRAAWQAGQYKLLPGTEPPSHCTSCGGSGKCAVCKGERTLLLTRDHREPRRAADPGYQLCTECGGTLWDVNCDGFRFFADGKRCSYCDDGTCMRCHGAGQLRTR